MRSYGIRVAPSPMTGVFINKAMWHDIYKASGKEKRSQKKVTRRHSDTQGRSPCKDGGRDWSDASANQGMPKIARMLEEAKNNSFLEPLEGAWPWGHLDFSLQASRTERE